MTKNIKHHLKASRNTKKAMIMKNNKKAKSPVYIGVFTVMLAAGAIILYAAMGTGVSPESPGRPTAEKINSTITYAANDFNDGKARHYHFKDEESGLTIKYFILKSADNVIRAAFDACDVCWPAGKGYVQEGAHMVCRNCGRRFASTSINVVQGGCNPAPLNRSFNDDQVMITIEDLKKGRPYFDFSKKA